MSETTRRKFLRTLGTMSAGLAAAWSSLVPEAAAQASYGGAAYGGTTTLPPASGGAAYGGQAIAVADLQPAQVSQLLQQATTSADVNNLLGRIGKPVVSGYPTAAYRQTASNFIMDSVVMPYGNASSTGADAMLIFVSIMATQGPSAGQSVPLALAVYPDRSSYLALEGQLLRTSFAPEYEQMLGEAFYPAAAETVGSSARAFAAAPIPPIDVDGNPRPGNPPGLTHCRSHCSVPCGAWPALMIGCVASLALYAILIYASAGVGAILAGTVGTAGVCVTAVSWYRACQTCWEMCRMANQRIWTDWMRQQMQQQAPAPG